MASAPTRPSSASSTRSFFGPSVTPIPRLVEITGVSKKGQTTGVSLPDFQAFQSRACSFKRIGVSRVTTFTLNGPHEPENLYGQIVSRECFDALGSPPIMGRTFTAADFDAAAPPVAVLSYPLWRSSFAADPQAVGRRVLMNGADYTVIGVMGTDFQFPQSVFKVWAPWKLSPEDLANRERSSVYSGGSSEARRIGAGGTG